LASDWTIGARRGLNEVGTHDLPDSSGLPEELVDSPREPVSEFRSVDPELNENVLIRRPPERGPPAGEFDEVYLFPASAPFPSDPW
jgi:hypothetical protein